MAPKMYRRTRRGFKPRYSAPVRMVRPIAQNEIRFVVEKVQVVKVTGGNSWVTMWNGGVGASTANDLTYGD